MHHSIPLITMLATAFGLALLLGFIAARLKLPVIVGYLLAGILIGPFTPGLVANSAIASELAEIGVMLLMFGVGLHFSFGDLLAVRKIALPGAILQIIVATALGAGIATAWGWDIGAALVFGLALSVASTVVLIRALEAGGILESTNGRIAVGWLVVEDLVMVMVLVLLPPLAEVLGGDLPYETSGGVWQTLIVTLSKVSIFIALMMLIGRRLFPKLLWQIAHTGSRELFTLCVVAAAITIACVASKLFDVSFALGAFFAGMMMRGSDFSHRAAEESLPFRETFAVLFFVSVGMLFNPRVLIDYPLEILAVMGIIIFGKTIAAAVLILIFRYPLNTALIVSISLAQIGEFSFILAGLGVYLDLLPIVGQNLILAGAILSIAINPLLFKLIEPLRTWLCAHSAFARKLESPADPLAELPMSTDQQYLSGQVVLVGYGRVGQRIGEVLHKNSVPFVVAEQNHNIVERLRKNNMTAVFGNASEAAVLIQAHITHAKMLIVATPNVFEALNMVKIARALNPKIEVAVRTHNEEEGKLLMQEKVERIFLGEEELGKSMAVYALERYSKITHAHVV